jgi:polyisoprenoid-binding protein YceI
METLTATNRIESSKVNTTNWILDPSHSEILFRVKHLMITNVRGEFRKFTAEAVTNGLDFNSGSVHVSIDASSLFTNEDKRTGPHR